MCSETREAVGTTWEHAQLEFQKFLKIRIPLAARQGFLRRGDRRRRHPCSPEGGRGAQDGHQAGACPQDLQQGARSTDQEESGVVDIGGVGAKSYQSHKHRGIPRNKFLMN